jgi:transcriptional regulator with XRE-family HTH domain
MNEFLVADVAGNRVRFSASISNFFSDPLEIMLATRCHDHAGATFGERHRQCFAEPLACASYDCSPSSNVHEFMMRSLCSYVVTLANLLSELHSADMNDAASLGQNVKELRQARGQTQGQLAKLAGIPRATWANLESGSANPTLSVMLAVARGLQVPLEELVSQPRAACKFYRRDELPTKKRGEVTVRKLLPDAIAGMEIDRFELPARSHMVGVPHTPGTREYLTCEKGKIILVAASEKWELGEGDVVVFRGDQRHSYTNAGDKTAIAYSVVLLAPVI